MGGGGGSAVGLGCDGGGMVCGGGLPFRWRTEAANKPSIDPFLSKFLLQKVMTVLKVGF